MNTQTYTFSVLRYRHSQALGEVLNVAVLLYVRAQKQLHFIYPERLVRLKFAYPDISERTLRTYLRFFEQRAQQLTQKPELFAAYDLERQPLDHFIQQEFLQEDASALVFAPSKAGVFYGDSIDKLIQYLNAAFLYPFEASGSGNTPMDETHLIHRYRKLLHEFLADAPKEEANLRENKKVEFHPTAHIREGKHLKFDFAWQNHTRNLVRPVSFDLKRRESIQRKAHQYYGQFMDPDVQSYAEKENCRFDLLLAKPRKKELFTVYDNAVKLLERPDHVKLVPEEELTAYTQLTIKAII